ncbi:NHLP family bacteriocin export ABC transporter peptidase/permease/ATPase subunit [Demetria terragena]|uniref:NHLP family bacteriocin export ABC transporter peptidase/permease/ATPase subunit n=1 Tax=Demetria terragena TaxID=63959 RepID=UPI000A038B8D|nr:NHLP family bacteriocin export ABC transporter peptidase/permease/ATPase subunit [Demetria terragena]
MRKPTRTAPPRVEEECAGLAPRRSARRATPTVIQMEAVECGAASLGIMLAHYGRHVPLEELRVACGVSRDGSNAKHLVEAAREYGLTGKGRRMEIPALMQIEHPVIVFWAFQHFMVVNGFERRRGRTMVLLNDPATGPRRMALTEFDQGFTGIVLDLVPDGNFVTGGQPPRTVEMLRERASRNGRGLALALLASVVLVIPGIIFPLFTQYYVDSVYGTPGFLSVVPLLIGLAVTATGTLILTTVQTHYLRLVEARSALTSAGRFIYLLLRLPMNFFLQRRPAELGRRVASNRQVAQTMTRDLVVTLVNLVLIVVYGAALIYLDVLLGVLAISVALINLVVLRVVMRRRVDNAAALEAEEGRLAVATLHTIASIETVKSSGTEPASFGRWSGSMAKAMTESQRLGVPTALLNVVPPMLATVNSGLVMLVGGLRVTDGALTVGVLFAFQALLTTFTRPLTQLTNQAAAMQEMQAQLYRLRDAENYETDPAFHETAGATDDGRVLSGRVDFDSVDFTFGSLQAPLVSGLSLSAEPGMRVALVGASGSGKSTIAKLAAGLLEPTSGRILFDGRPRSEWSRQTMSASVSYVDQTTTLFEGTVRDNICFWDEEIRDENVLRALRDSEMFEVIARRPGGITSAVAEGGSNFSGGQRQRLELARALVTDPTLLVLDEATSALDTATERIVMDNLRRRGCALLIIAHRMSTVRDADLILVVEDGAVVESGRHDELVALGGTYHGLVMSDRTDDEED